MRPCIVFNPAARGDKARRFRGVIESFGRDVVLKPTTGPGAARALAREAVEAGHDVVIAAGGDGTLFEVLNGIADAPGGFERTTLGVLPLGTANVFARDLDLPLDPSKAWDALHRGSIRTVDCGFVEFRDESGGTRSAHFLAVAGAGLDARAVQLVDWNLKKRIGELAYIVASLRALLRYRDWPRCEIGGRPFSGRAIVIGNGRFYAGDVPVFADGALDSGRLHVLAVESITPRMLALGLLSYLTRRWLLSGSLKAASVTDLTIESGAPVPLQLDGEFAGWLPARFRVLPGALRVLAPATEA